MPEVGIHPSAFPRRHREKFGWLLVHMLAPAFWALDPALFVFRNGQEEFKRLLAIFAIKLVVRQVSPSQSA